MKEEDKILELAGRDNPFRVPEGYFEGLTDQIMARLPEPTATNEKAPTTVRITMWDRVKPWLYMAAMFIGAALIIRVATHVSSPQDATLATDDTEREMSYLDNVMDHSMMDSYQLYVYLSEEEEYGD